MLFSARPWSVHFETAVECATSNKNISSFFLQPFVSTGMFLMTLRCLINPHLKGENNDIA